jgi:hypothetical protein
MTKHPCEGMTKAEITAFEAIAINRSPNCSKKTIEKLLARGVIVDEKRNVNFKDGLPPVAVDDYFVPLPIHYQWCQWVSERYRGTI